MTQILSTPTIENDDTLTFEGTNHTIVLPALTEDELEAGVTYNEDFLNGDKTNTKLARALTRYAEAAEAHDQVKALHAQAGEAYRLEAEASGQDFDSKHYGAFRQVRRNLKNELTNLECILKTQETAIINTLKGNYRPMNPVAVKLLVGAEFGVLVED